MRKEFKEALEDSPIIVAIKDDEGLKKCITSDSRVIFILYGDILTIPDIVAKVKTIFEKFTVPEVSDISVNANTKFAEFEQPEITDKTA